MNTLLSATTLTALLRAAVRTPDGNVDVDATCELVRRSLVEGPKSKAVTADDMNAVSAAVSSAFDQAGAGKPIQRAVLTALATLACPENGERILAEILSSDAYQGRQKVGFYRAGEAPPVKAKPAAKPLQVVSGASPAASEEPSEG